MLEFVAMCLDLLHKIRLGFLWLRTCLRCRPQLSFPLRCQVRIFKQTCWGTFPAMCGSKPRWGWVPERWRLRSVSICTLCCPGRLGATATTRCCCPLLARSPDGPPQSHHPNPTFMNPERSYLVPDLEWLTLNLKT